MGRIWLLPVLLAIWVCGEPAAEACGCAPRSASCGPPAEFWRAAAVFTGRVAAIERVSARGRPGAERLAIVQVTESFRGAIRGRDVTLVIRPVCSYRFKTGQSYLIFAVRTEDGRLTVSVCSRTIPLERAGADLEYARAAVRGAAPPGTIVGEVREDGDGRVPGRPLPRVAVTAASAAASYAATTDEHGRYTIAPGQAGAFTIAAALPDGRYSPQSPRSIELVHPLACVRADIDVKFDGWISGRVVDESDRGIPGLTLSFGRVGRGGGRTDPVRTVTRDDGTYRFERLPAGPFVVAIDLPAADRPLATVALASRVTGTLAAGERRSVETITLPPEVPIARLEGVVRGADGAAAAHVRVFLRAGEDEGHVVGEPAVTDALGRFAIAVIEGVSYEVFAVREERGALRRTEFSAPVAFTAGAATPPVVVTLRRAF
jgi:hypothetical protein